MKWELRRVEPLRAANVAALVYGLVMAAFMVIMVPFFLLFAVFAPKPEGAFPAVLLPLIMLIAYPILGLVMGWISGLLSAAIYNLVVRWIGGLQLELAERSSVPPLTA